MKLDRRKLLAGMSIAALGVPLKSIAGIGQVANGATHFDPRQYGARGDGRALDSKAINAAIDACAAAGGGVVSLAQGTYRSGTIVLKSNVTLNINASATILGSTNIDDFSLPSELSGTPKLDPKHLILAVNASNVGLAGTGRIDGQGPAFWKKSGRPPLPPDQSWADVASHALEPNGKRPSPMLEFVHCTGVRIEDLHIENAPSWTMRTANCDQVRIQGVSVKNPVNGPNTDGMDITSCSNVLISDCTIDTGDDAICLKSQNPYGDQPFLTQNIVVTNCSLTTCCNGFKLGTNSEGGFENITFSNSVITNNEVDLAQRVISGVALEVVDGGWIEGLHVSGIRMQRTRTPIFIRLGNRAQKFDNPKHGIRGVTISDIHATESVLASSITGLENMFVEDVTLSNIQVECVLRGRADLVDRPVPEAAQKYPEARMFGMLPASGLYCRHARGLRLSDVSFQTAAGEQRPTLICEDVRGMQITALTSSPVQGDEPVVKLVQCQEISITRSTAPAGSSAYVAVEGAQSASIVVSGCDLRGAKRSIDSSSDVRADAVTVSNNPSVPQ